MVDGRTDGLCARLGDTLLVTAVVITSKRFYELSERRERISVDIDAHAMRKDNLAVLKAFFMLKAFFPKGEVEVEKTGHGFHVKAVDPQINSIPMSKRLDIRQALCDDWLRLDWDRQKLLWGEEQLCETLFVMKRGFDGKLHKVHPIDPVALPFVSRLPD